MGSNMRKKQETAFKAMVAPEALKRETIAQFSS